MDAGTQDILGLIPAAGRAERLHGLPKYLLPLPDGFLLRTTVQRVKAVGADPMIAANDENYNLITRYAGVEPGVSVNVTKPAHGMPGTILNLIRFAYAGYRGYLCIMPDTYWSDKTLLPRMVDAMRSGADLVIGAFRAAPGQSAKLGMIDNAGGRLVIRDKPGVLSELILAWGVLLWQHPLLPFIDPDDPHMGDFINRVSMAGCRVDVVTAVGRFWDCGTFDEYAELIKVLTKRDRRGTRVS